MAVVTIVGVLAILATLSYRRHLAASRATEATHQISNIRKAEESYRAKYLTYLDVSTSITSYFPSTAPSGTKTAWPTPGCGGPACTHADVTRWFQLNAVPDGPVVYGYAVKSGLAYGTPPSLPTDFDGAPTFVAQTEPWYVVLASADQDANGTKAYALGVSWSAEITHVREGE